MLQAGFSLVWSSSFKPDINHRSKAFLGAEQMPAKSPNFTFSSALWPFRAYGWGRCADLHPSSIWGVNILVGLLTCCLFLPCEGPAIGQTSGLCSKEGPLMSPCTRGQEVPSPAHHHPTRGAATLPWDRTGGIRAQKSIWAVTKTNPDV